MKQMHSIFHHSPAELANYMTLKCIELGRQKAFTAEELERNQQIVDWVIIPKVVCFTPKLSINLSDRETLYYIKRSDSLYDLFIGFRNKQDKQRFLKEMNKYEKD